MHILQRNIARTVSEENIPQWQDKAPETLFWQETHVNHLNFKWLMIFKGHLRDSVWVKKYLQKKNKQKKQTLYLLKKITFPSKKIFTGYKSCIHNTGARCPWISVRNLTQMIGLILEGSLTDKRSFVFFDTNHAREKPYCWKQTGLNLMVFILSRRSLNIDKMNKIMMFSPHNSKFGHRTLYVFGYRGRK